MKSITSSRNKLALAIVFSLSILNSSNTLAECTKPEYQVLAVVAILFIITKRNLDVKRAALTSTKNVNDNTANQNNGIAATLLDFIESFAKPIAIVAGLIGGIEKINSYVFVPEKKTA